MSTVAIVAAGSFPRTEYPRYLLRSADHCVCCDGALGTLEKHGIVPDVVIGDLDSVCSRALGRFRGETVRVDEQDTNDLTKAFTFCLERWPDVTGITILGASGRREDHTLANYSLLMEYERQFRLGERGIRLEMVSDYSTAFAISSSTTLHVGAGRPVSLFTADPSLQIRSEGLHWPTDGVRFDNWWKATLNRADRDAITLTLSHEAPVLVILS